MTAAIALSGLLGLVVQILVAGLVFYLVYWLVNFINPPEPFKKVLICILAIVGVLFLINLLLSLSGNGFITW